MDDFLIILLLFFFIGALFILLGFPLLLGKIKPNWFYGFRTPSTVKNKDIWYIINKQTGREFIIAGIIIVIAFMIMLLFQSYITIIQLVFILLILVNISLITIIGRGFALLKKLKNK
jgi:uncharacterized membrane protein